MPGYLGPGDVNLPHAADTPGYTPPGGTSTAAFTGPGKITQPAFTPDYPSLIDNDPGLVAFKQALSAQGISDAAQRAAATQRALIQFGLVPDFAGAASALGISGDAASMLGQDVTPEARALAAQNTAGGMSTEAQLQRSNDQAVTALRNSLAARGALSSGDAVYRLGNQEQSYEQTQRDALSKVLDAIGGYQSAYLNAQHQGATDLAAQYGAAAARQEQLPQNQARPAQTYTYDATSGKYVGPGGHTYTPHSVGGGFVIVDDDTGSAFKLNGDGSIGGATTYTPPAPPAATTTTTTQTTPPPGGSPGDAVVVGPGAPKVAAPPPQQTSPPPNTTTLTRGSAPLAV